MIELKEDGGYETYPFGPCVVQAMADGFFCRAPVEAKIEVEVSVCQPGFLRLMGSRYAIMRGMLDTGSMISVISTELFAEKGFVRPRRDAALLDIWGAVETEGGLWGWRNVEMCVSLQNSYVAPRVKLPPVRLRMVVAENLRSKRCMILGLDFLRAYSFLLSGERAVFL